jgi:hypothetical protein
VTISKSKYGIKLPHNRGGPIRNTHDPATANRICFSISCSIPMRNAVIRCVGRNEGLAHLPRIMREVIEGGIRARYPDDYDKILEEEKTTYLELRAQAIRNPRRWTRAIELLFEDDEED